MNRVSRLRLTIQELYESNDLEKAAEAGEELLREHDINENEKAMPYANDLFNLACIYDALGEYERAISLYGESASEIMEMGGDPVEFSYRLTNLAALLSTCGNTEGAYFMFQHASFIMRSELDASDPALADCFYNTANAADDVGRLNEAVRLHKEALKIRRNAGSVNNDVVNSLLSIAFIHENADDNETAIRYASDALSETQGDDYFQVQFYLAGLYDACKKYDRAEELYRSVLKWAEEKAGREHSAFINVSLKLGHTLAQGNKQKEALEVLKEIHQTFQKIDGEKHLFYANCLRSMSIIHRQLGQPEEAEDCMLDSLRIRARHGDAELAEDKLFLLDLYLDWGRQDKALDLLVYILMQNETGEKEFIKGITQTLLAKGGKKTEALLALIERVNNPEGLKPIIERWEQWEKGE